MIARIKVEVYLEVNNGDEAEEACMALENLDGVLRSNSFPHGEVIQSDVGGWEQVSDAEADELGLTE
jgi:hypothetical protein